MDQSNADASGRTPGPEPQGAATPPEVAQGRGDEHGQGLPGEGRSPFAAGERPGSVLPGSLGPGVEPWSGPSVDEAGAEQEESAVELDEGTVGELDGTSAALDTEASDAARRGTGRLRRCWPLVGISAGLLLAVWIVFGQTRRFQFVNWDDHVYLDGNPHVAAGLSAKGIWWAFSESYAANWHPLTWLSHMVDCQFYGLNPAGHHMTSVALHGATAVLLFLLLVRLGNLGQGPIPLTPAPLPQGARGDRARGSGQKTGGSGQKTAGAEASWNMLWPSAVVAAVFAVHPLRAESVAYVAERKDVLSGLFFLLTLWAYERYARQPFAWRRYLAVVLLFAAGLMAKPMLVTLPLVLLLLDYWPLGRQVVSGQWSVVSGESSAAQRMLRILRSRVVLEKLPLVALAAASGVITLVAQREAMGRVATDVSLPWRLGNAVVAYVSYVRAFVWPAGLTPFYPHPGRELSLWSVAGAALLLTAVTWAVLWWRKTWPWLMVGWLWYLVMLLPVIGVVQVGKQGMADRYTYLPEIGLAIAVAWSMAALGQMWPNQRGAWTAIVLAALGGLLACGWRQASYWHDSETLWQRAVHCTPDSDLAQMNLGTSMAAGGKLSAALVHYHDAVHLMPEAAENHYNLAAALVRLGDDEEAEQEYRQAVRLRRDYSQAWCELGSLLLGERRLDDAIAAFTKALDGDDAFLGHVSLGMILMRQGRQSEAQRHFAEALRLRPGDKEAEEAVANVLRGR